MSKKSLMLSVAVLFGIQASLALAANPDTGPGCGLGKLLWADAKHQKNIAPQVLMATTNGTGNGIRLPSVPERQAAQTMGRSWRSIKLLFSPLPISRP